MAYKIVNKGPQIPKGYILYATTPNEALNKVWAGRRAFGAAIVLDENGIEVSDAELKRRVALGRLNL